MNLQKAANEAMAYLDSVGVAADYDIDKDGGYGLCITTDDNSFLYKRKLSINYIMTHLRNAYPQKSPA